MRTLAALMFGIAVGVLPAHGQTVVSSFPVAPAGVAFLGGLEYDCNSGIVWIADETNNIISAYTTAGVFLKSYPAPIPPGSAVLDPQPIGMGMNPTTGQLWVGDEGEYVFEMNPLTGLPTGVSWSTLPTINDVSGVAVDPATGNIYVSQDSGTRMIAEFTPAGTLVTTIITPTVSTDPDGLAYDPNTGRFYLGDDIGDSIFEVDAAGTLTNTWSLAGLGISPEGLGIDPVNGLLLVADGFVTRQVFAVSGILPPTGICVPGPTTFFVAVSTSGGGVGDGTAVIANVPAGTTEGWFVYSLDTALPVNTGPIFGASPDANSFNVLAQNPVATPGGPFHWAWPAPGFFPAVPFTLPPGTLSALAGQTWDFLALAVGPGGFTPSFNVSRVTW